MAAASGHDVRAIGFGNGFDSDAEAVDEKRFDTAAGAIADKNAEYREKGIEPFPQGAGDAYSLSLKDLGDFCEMAGKSCYQSFAHRVDLILKRG